MAISGGGDGCLSFSFSLSVRFSFFQSELRNGNQCTYHTLSIFSLPGTKSCHDWIYLTTIGGPWYFWKGICVSKAHKPVTLSGNATFTKV